MINLIGSNCADLSKLPDKPRQFLKLGRVDAIRLIEALARPATMNARLKAAAKRFNSKAQ